MITSSIFCQAPPEEFFIGLDILDADISQAKKQFLLARDKDSLFHGTHHFLGVIYLDEGQIDSAIICFKKSLALNKENVNHTKEMAYVRLFDSYLKKHDFDNSFSIAWEAHMQYPDNGFIIRELKDICLWSFYINHNNLDSSYLSSEIKDEYIVNSIPEEYLIVRKLRVKDQPLVFSSQSLVKEKRISYDIISCTLPDNKGSYDVKFRLNWDMNKDFGGNVANTENVSSNSEYPIQERIGALLVSDSKIDLKKEMK